MIDHTAPARAEREESLTARAWLYVAQIEARCAGRHTMTDTTDALLARIAKMEQALAFYADCNSYVGHRDPDASVYVETSAIDTDGGRRAREALGGV